jgi:hypothetical protein
MKMTKALALALAIIVALLAGVMALSHRMYHHHATPVAAPIAHVQKAVVAPEVVERYRGRSKPMVAHPHYGGFNKKAAADAAAADAAYEAAIAPMTQAECDDLQASAFSGCMYEGASFSLESACADAEMARYPDCN